MGSQDGPFSTASRQWMEWWNGSGSAFLHGNCVQYCHDNLQRRGKNKTRNWGGGGQWKGSNQGWQDKPWQILSLNFQLRLFLLCPSSSRFMNHSLADLSITSPPGRLSRRCCSADGVIQVWENYQLLAWWLLCVDRVIRMCHSTYSVDPARQLSPLSTETCTSLKRTPIFPSEVRDHSCCVAAAVVRRPQVFKPGDYNDICDVWPWYSNSWSINDTQFIQSNDWLACLSTCVPAYLCALCPWTHCTWPQSTRQSRYITKAIASESHTNGRESAAKMSSSSSTSTSSHCWTKQEKQDGSRRGNVPCSSCQSL